MPAGADATGQDFVNVQIGQLAGTVYADVNGNGRHEAGEPGVAGAVTGRRRGGRISFEMSDRCLVPTCPAQTLSAAADTTARCEE